MDRRKIIDPLVPVHVLDIKGLVTRSYHSGTDAHPVRDEDTGARVNSAGHGMANFIERILTPILKEVAPINIIAVSDGGNDLRRTMFPGYKEKRKERDKEYPKAQQEQLKLLLEQVNRLLCYLGATTLKVERREADDVISAVVRSMKAVGQPVMIHTVDQDMIQEVDEDAGVFLTLFDAPRLTYINHYESAATGKDCHEIEPGLVALYKSLIGDSSDEYGGVKGFGPVKWNELTAVLDTDGLYELDRMARTGDFSDLREAVAANPDIKVLTLLLTQSTEWRLMHYLARLHPESVWGSIGKDLIKPVWTKRVPDRQKALQALAVVNCDDMIDQFEQWFPTRLLGDEHHLADAFGLVNEHLEDSPVVGFDYEGYDKLKNPAFQEAVKRRKGGYVDVLSQKVTGASICLGANLQHSIYFPTLHKDTANINAGYIPDIINEVQGCEKPLVIQNAGFEMTVTHMNFGDAAEIFRPHDTRVMAAYYDENIMGLGMDGLKDMSWELLRYRQTEYGELLKMHEAEDMRGLTGEQTLVYGCDDSVVACHLWVLFRYAMILERQWRFFLEKHTAPAHVMEYAFRKGVNIDWDELARLRDADQIVIDEGNAKIRALLEEHCTGEADEKAVDAFIAADLDAIRYTLAERWKKKNKGDGDGDEVRVGRERMDALLAEYRISLLAKSIYEPYIETKRTYDFIGSGAQLRDICGYLRMEHVLEKNSNKAIQEWALLYSGVKLPEDQREFVTRVAGAAGKPLKDRAGPEFEDLREICTKIIAPHLKSDWTGDELNYDSPQQMQALLYLKLGLPVRRRSKVDRGSFRHERGLEGSPGTDKRAIAAALAEDCQGDDWRRELLTTLRDVKAAMTRFELFWTPYPLWRHPVDGCVHPGVKDPGTVTRRPTSGSPNILQVSKGPTRGMFIPHHQEERTGSVDKLLAGVMALAEQHLAEEEAA